MTHIHLLEVDEYMYTFLDDSVPHISHPLHMDCFGYKEVDILFSIQMEGSHILQLLDIHHSTDIQLLYMLLEDCLVIQEDSSKLLYVPLLYILLYLHIEHLYMDLYILC